ncbi:MAG: hypothetical protein IKT60_01545 [Clostridia bacterium]|nr:hypothetical protein [Clostridia bacterium]
MKPVFSVISAAGGLLLLLLCPSAAADGARAGLSLTIEVLLPSLFPFMVLTDLLTGSALPGTERRFLSFILGFAGGYPTGARLVCGLYSSGRIRREEAEWRLGWCSNCGIGFLFGTVAAGLLGRPALGITLLLSQVLSALCCALFLRPPRRASVAVFLPTAAGGLPAALSRAAKAMAGVGSGVILISALLSAAESLLPPLPPLISALLRGTCELSLGARAAAALPGGGVLLSSVCAFGGLCVHLQCLGFISAARLSPRRYFAGKALQALLAAFFAFVFHFCW